MRSGRRDPINYDKKCGIWCVYADTHTHTHWWRYRVCQLAAPVNAWQSDIHRLVNPTTWQDFTQTAERERGRDIQKQALEVKMQFRALKLREEGGDCAF